MPDSISIQTARRFVLGRQGLWPGRRWRGLPGTERAMLAMRQLQLDPLVVIARAHDLMLQSRVIDYRIDDWATLTYEKRRFFEWGGWLAVRPIEELPHWRVLMRRERSQPHWQEVVNAHRPAIEEMRAVLHERGTVSNRDFAMHTRTRVDSYRGSKDSALALHYLWRVGDAMVARRERFERVYAPTDAIVPARLSRESSDAEADDFLLMKMVAVAGLTQLHGVNASLLRTVAAPEIKAWRERKLADGELIEVRVEGWKAPQLALGSEAATLEAVAAGRVPRAWRALDTTTDDEATFLAPLDPVVSGGRAKVLFDFDYKWEVYTPAHLRRWGYYTLPILWGDRLVARFDAKLDRPRRALVINGFWTEDAALAKDGAFADALARGMARFLTFLEAERANASAVQQPKLRKAISSCARIGQ
jgi:uncharacterized protein YcaQ